MKEELEAKYLNVDKEQVCKMLLAKGGKLLKKNFLMRRNVFNYPKGVLPENEKKWGRVRDEGEKITMAIKQITDKTKIEGTKEIEIIVDNFEKAGEIFTILRLLPTSYQENYREIWDFNNCRITLDTWPGLKTFIEIEGNTKEIVVNTSNKLGFNFEEAIFGSIDLIYERVLNIDPGIFNKIESITFENYQKVLSLKI